MKSDLRTVLDTGVIVSALLLPRSEPRRAFDLAVAHGRLLVSDETVAELDEVLRRKKFDNYLTEAQRLEFLSALVRETEMVEVLEAVAECRDPKDNKFLALALSGRASHIITGDLDLRVLHPFRGIPALSPGEFLSLPDWPPST